MQSFTVSKRKLAPVIISGHLSIFKALKYFSKRFHIFRALSYFQSAFIFSQRFIIFKVLYYFSKRFYFLSKRFYSNFPSVSQRMFIFSKCESALFTFFFQKHYSALALISGCEAHNFLIMLLIIFDILNMFQY
jgi:hypothetical protein